MKIIAPIARRIHEITPLESSGVNSPMSMSSPIRITNPTPILGDIWVRNFEKKGRRIANSPIISEIIMWTALLSPKIFMYWKIP